MSEVNRTQAPQSTGPAPATGPSSTGTGTGGSGNFANTVTVAAIGAELAKLSIGQRIDATVLRSDPSGNARLSLGTTQVVVHLKPPPPKGTNIQFQVTSVKPAISLQLLDNALAIRPHAHVVNQSTLLQQRIAPGQVLQAHFAPNEPLRLSPSGHPLMAANSPAKAYAANAVATISSRQSSIAPNNGPVAIRILAINGGTPMAPASHLTPKGAAITGELSTSPAGEPTVKTPVGRFTLERPPGLPDGTRIQLQIIPSTPRPAMIGTQSSPVMATTHVWDEFQQSLQQAIANPTIHQAVASATPQAGPRLATTVVFLLSALYGGRLQDWLGREALETLQREQPRLLARLLDGFSQLGQTNREPVQGDWRLIYLPFLSDTLLSPLRMFLRGQANEEAPDKNTGHGGLRFVLEAELSRLGLFQLDGLVRNRNFDLSVHTSRELPDEHQAAIRQIFAEAGHKANFAGRLDFATLPVVLADEAKMTTAHAHSGLLA